LIVVFLEAWRVLGVLPRDLAKVLLSLRSRENGFGELEALRNDGGDLPESDGSVSSSKTSGDQSSLDPRRDDS